MRSIRTRRGRRAGDPSHLPALATVRPFQVQRDDDEVGPSAPAEDDAAGVLDSYLNKRQIARTVPPAGAWSADDGTIQRYTVVEPDNLFAEKDTKVTTRDISQTKYGSAYSETETTVGRTGRNPQARSRLSTVGSKKKTVADSGLPAFRVSESGLLAVPDQGQARNFYAGEATVDSANQVFAAAGTELRLTRAGHGIRVPRDPEDPESSGTRSLDKVHAAKEIPQDAEHAAHTEIAQTFPVTECDSFIKLVLGAATSASRLAVLEDYNGNSPGTTLRADSGREPIVPIAREMTRGQKAPTANRVRNALVKRPKLPQEEIRQGQVDYEQLDPEDREARSKKLGVNEFALPEVGEGFVIRSMRTEALLDAMQEQGAGQDQPVVHTQETRQAMREGYLAALEELEKAEENLEAGRSDVSARVQAMMRTWGEHYAGVVAKDGEDVVTLENYNRWQEIQWEHERIFNNLFRDFAAFQRLVANEVESLDSTPDVGTIRRLVGEALKGKKLKKQYRDALNEAQASFVRGLELKERTGVGNFFFQMYGPGEQSFHSAYEGTASNPMTLHIKESDAAVRAEAVHWLGELDTVTTDIGTGNTAHPVPGATANILARTQTARARHTQLTLDLAAANTRGAYKRIETRALIEKNTMATDVRAELCAAYERITGTQLAQQPYSFQGLRQVVDTYVNGYSWYQRVGTRYNSITALQALLVAIENH